MTTERVILVPKSLPKNKFYPDNLRNKERAGDLVPPWTPLEQPPSPLERSPSPWPLVWSPLPLEKTTWPLEKTTWTTREEGRQGRGGP